MSDKRPNPDFFLVSQARSGVVFLIRVNGQHSHEDQRPSPSFGRSFHIVRATLEDMVIPFHIYTLKPDGTVGARMHLVQGSTGKYLRSAPDGLEGDDFKDVPVGDY